MKSSQNDSRRETQMTAPPSGTGWETRLGWSRPLEFQRPKRLKPTSRPFRSRASSSPPAVCSVCRVDALRAPVHAGVWSHHRLLLDLCVPAWMLGGVFLTADASGPGPRAPKLRFRMRRPERLSLVLIFLPETRRRGSSGSDSLLGGGDPENRIGPWFVDCSKARADLSAGVLSIRRRQARYRKAKLPSAAPIARQRTRDSRHFWPLYLQKIASPILHPRKDRQLHPTHSPRSPTTFHRTATQHLYLARPRLESPTKRQLDLATRG